MNMSVVIPALDAGTVAAPRAIYRSTKSYDHSEGLSCCFRQWRATHSHCSLVHQGVSLRGPGHPAAPRSSATHSWRN